MPELKLPDLGEDIEDAEVLKVLVSSGDTIEKDQPILEMETDKATFEVPSTVAGTVSEVSVSQGDRLRIGQTILTFEEGAPPAESGSRGKEAARQSSKEAEEGERADDETKEDVGAEPEAAQRENERERRERDAGEPRRRGAGETEPGEDREEGEHARRPREEDEAEAEPRGDEPHATSRLPGQRGRDVAAGPAARRLARELGVDIARVSGSEAGGRITTDDVKKAARRRSETDGSRAPASSSLPDFERWGRVERRRLNGIERAAARHLSQSWRAIPHVTQHDVADVTELEQMRQRFEERRAPSDPKLTATALVVKVVVAALRAFPRVNASLDVESEELILKRYVHIGVAVDTDDGLLVPVVRDADHKTTRQIAAEIAGLAERARERKLTRDEMQGASFTVTNLGGIGGTAFTPIVSHPEVAILGVSRVRSELTMRDGELAQRLMMPLSLSYDHRALNGADAARFTRHVAALLEDPLRLLVES